MELSKTSHSFRERLIAVGHPPLDETDEALYANKLSVVYEDITLARETLDRVREFVASNPTV